MDGFVNLPDNLYSGSAVTFNPQPYVNYIVQANARQQAKQEAVDNYYRDLSKTLTPAGMAGNDVEDFNNKVNQWRGFVTQNRNVLSNPRDKNYAQAVTQAGYLYNDALGHAAQSKQKVSELDKANQLRLAHPDYKLTDAALMSMNNASLPLSKGYKPLDWSTINYDNKPAEAKDLNTYMEYVQKGLQMDEGNPTVSVDPKTKTKIVTTKSSYSPAALNVMSTRAETLYKTDPKFHELVTKMSQDPQNYNQLNAKFKSIYGHDLDIQHPEEFATALLLPQTEKINTQPYTFNPTTIKINMGDGGKTGMSLDNYIAQLQANAEPREVDYGGGKKETRYQIQPSPELSNLFAAKVGSSTIYPDQIQFLPNGDVMPVFYKLVPNPSDPTHSITKVDSKGNASIDNSLSKPVSQSEFRIRLAKAMFGEKGLMNVMQSNQTQTNNLPKPTQSNYTNITTLHDAKGNAVQAGVKNGKWYNIQTGKPIE